MPQFNVQGSPYMGPAIGSQQLQQMQGAVQINPQQPQPQQQQDPRLQQMMAMLLRQQQGQQPRQQPQQPGQFAPKASLFSAAGGAVSPMLMQGGMMNRMG